MTSRKPTTTDPTVTVSGMADLLALHKTIMEAKFHQDPDNADVLGSPLLARIANDVVDALILTEQQAGRAAKAASWQAFRQLSSRQWVADRVYKQVLQNANWAKWDTAYRDSYLRDALAPFLPTSAEVAALRARIERDYT